MWDLEDIILKAIIVIMALFITASCCFMIFAVHASQISMALKVFLDATSIFCTATLWITTATILSL